MRFDGYAVFYGYTVMRLCGCWVLRFFDGYTVIRLYVFFYGYSVLRLYGHVVVGFYVFFDGYSIIRFRGFAVVGYGGLAVMRSLGVEVWRYMHRRISFLPYNLTTVQSSNLTTSQP